MGTRDARLAVAVRVAVYVALVVGALVMGNVFFIGGNLPATPFLIGALVWSPRSVAFERHDVELGVRGALGVLAVALGLGATLLSVALTEPPESVQIVATGSALWLATALQLSFYAVAVFGGYLASASSRAVGPGRANADQVR